MKFIKKVILLISIINCFISSSCFAANFSSIEEMIDFFDRNGIFYFNPQGYTDGCYDKIGSYDGIKSAGLSDLNAAFVDQYHDIAAQLGAEYGIPWEAVMAQGIIESASGTSNFATERYNFFGIGAVDNNPGAAYRYSSATEGWRGYYEFIQNNPRYQKHGAFNYPDDPYAYIQAIKDAGYATDEAYVEKVSKIIKAVQNRANEKNWSSSKDLAHSSIKQFSHLCSNDGNGDINSTALKLSWADRSHSLDDPIPTYRDALNLVGLSNYPDYFARIGASCDAFVATVLRYSGVDSNVPCCGVSRMMNYFSSHPEKYQEIPNIGNSSNLQPGDIRVNNRHVELYVHDGSGKIASASHSERTADHAINFYVDTSYRIFRAK